MFNFEIINGLHSFLHFGNTVLCSNVLNPPSESSSLWHCHSQYLAFEALKPSSQLAKLGVCWELLRRTFGTQSLCSLLGIWGAQEGAYPHGACSLVQRPAGLCSLEGPALQSVRCQSSAVEVLWEPQEPFPLGTGLLHKEPNSSLSRIVFCSVKILKYNVYFISFLHFRLCFLFPQAFLFCPHEFI